MEPRTRSVANVARASAENTLPFTLRVCPPRPSSENSARRCSAASINARSAAARLSASFAAGTFAPAAARRASAPAMRTARFRAFSSVSEPPFSSVSFDPPLPNPAAASERLEMTSIGTRGARRSGDLALARESIRKNCAAAAPSSSAPATQSAHLSNHPVHSDSSSSPGSPPSEPTRPPSLSRKKEILAVSAKTRAGVVLVSSARVLRRSAAANFLIDLLSNTPSISWKTPPSLTTVSFRATRHRPVAITSP